MKRAEELIPWSVTDISVYPYGTDYWSMNPSIHLAHDGTWRCVTRIVDYAMPGGVTIRSKGARSVGQQTRNAMLILDPASWKPIQVFKMHEQDSFPRVACPHIGYEDMRIFYTDRGGLQGIAAALHLRRDHDRRAVDTTGMPQHQPPEQVLLSFDNSYNIVEALPIRGGGWSGPQKNWVPFDDCAEPRFLYSIGKGSMFDESGAVSGDRATVRPSARARPLGALHAAPLAQRQPLVPLSKPAPSPEPADVQRDRDDHSARAKHRNMRTMIRGGDVQIVRGSRMAIDTTARPSPRAPSIDAMSSRPSSRPFAGRPVVTRGGGGSTRVVDTARTLPPRYEGLRGGTQLVRVGADVWLGIGHEMKFVTGKKYYWHVFYLVDSCGKLIAASLPCKLAPEGIEFAAGIAIDGDRVVVSFGVDDMACRLGETSLSALLDALIPVDR